MLFGTAAATKKHKKKKKRVIESRRFVENSKVTPSFI